MGNIKAEEAMRELTLMLLYLSRFTQREKFHEATDFYAWKGYDFDILNELDDADYIRQGNHPSRSKSVIVAVPWNKAIFILGGRVTMNR